MAINFGRDMNEVLGVLMSLLLNKVFVPTQFHERCKVIEEMVESDSSGLVSSLVNFQIACATVPIKIDTESPKLNEILNEEWLDNLNKEFRGKGVETGIKGLEKEYYKERWKGASFPVLKIAKWDTIGGLNLPVSMIFVDGGSIYAQDDNDEDSLSLFGYRYYLGKAMEEEIAGEAYLMYKNFTRWFSKYPSPYLIRRGVYKNWLIINTLKDKQIELVKQVIPYLLLIKKGSEALEIQKDVTVDKDQLEEVKLKVQELLDRLNTANKEAPLRATPWDEKIEHLIPDLQAMFRGELFATSERNICAGLGFVDADTLVTSRKESNLNPKPFIKEVNAGIDDFKLILKDLISLIKEKNENVEDINHRKYNAMKWIVVSRPVTEFKTDEFLALIRSLSDRGRISNELEHELIDANHELELRRREREIEDEEEVTFYPKVIVNQENVPPNLREEVRGVPIRPQKKPKSLTKEVNDGVPEDRREAPEKRNFTQAMLEEEPIDDNLVFIDNTEMELTSGKWIAERTTTNYIRRGQINPDKFQKDSFRTIWISKSEKIKAIIGRLIGEKTTTIQSYLFDRAKWSESEVDEWIKEHKEKIKSQIELVGAPYAGLGDLPDYIKKLPTGLQKIWRKSFNYAWERFKNLPTEQRESRSFRYANGVLKKIRKSKKKGIIESFLDKFLSK